MPSLDTRLAKIEQRSAVGAEQHAQIEHDAVTFDVRLKTMAAAFGDDDGVLGMDVQAGWSPASRLAWAMRFAPRQVPQLIANAKEMLACRAVR